jgi:hypothetical protein
VCVWQLRYMVVPMALTHAGFELAQLSPCSYVKLFKMLIKGRIWRGISDFFHP